MDAIVVMVVDRQAYYRAGLCQVLSQDQDLRPIEGPADQNLLQFIEANSVDVLLLDIDLPSLRGLEVCRSITRHFPATKVAILTPDPDDAELFEAIKTGAVAYLSKNASPAELVAAIKQAHGGQYPINNALMERPSVAERVLRQFRAEVSMGRGVEAITAPLTARETQVLQCIAEGNSNKSIARLLQISEQTSKNHVSSILRKLNANDRAHAVALAIRDGWISGARDDRPDSAPPADHPK